MKIIILGAGRVGASVAEKLVSENNDITVVDTDVENLKLLQDKLDLRTVAGNGTHPPVMQLAGIEDADMLIATATRDETNLVACQLAARLFNVPTRVARIRAPEFLDHPEITGEDGFKVDYLICPEQTVTDYIAKLIEFPEALQVLEFADGQLSLIAVRTYAGGPMVAHPIRELAARHPNVDMRVVAIFRGDHSIRPDGDTLIEPGDEVFILAASEHIRTALSDLRRMDKPVRRIMIAGGGNIGLRLARQLGSDYRVRIVEADARRCTYLATQLPVSTLVLHGDATDEGLLVDEGVADMDLFVALTSDDENNIMSCMLAKRLGARRTIALINRQAYADLVQGNRIDIAIVPSQTTIGQLLMHVRRGDVAAVHSLRRGAAEALEAIAHGDMKSSKVVGRRIDQIDLPRGATIGAIVRPPRKTDQSEAADELRGAQVIMAHHDTVIESGDHVVVFVEHKRSIAKVERLFQVSAGFF
ncbi:MAG: Trk system potassium transporter TrkA [Burkholderiales bacterium]|nr:Trk system potassium transporter TrkA [Burkholderiales bacterium]ODU68942.1 MAG: Trk system potassium transport protein TrkA [Lautropia sp. SCN 66-9]